MQTICTSLQTDNHTSSSSLNFFTGQLLFLTPNRVKALKAQSITALSNITKTPNNNSTWNANVTNMKQTRKQELGLFWLTLYGHIPICWIYKNVHTTNTGRAATDCMSLFQCLWIFKNHMAVKRLSCTNTKLIGHYYTGTKCRQDFVTGGKWGMGLVGLEYEVSQSRLYCLCINVALCSTALQCICRVIQRSFMTMKAHTYYTIFGRPPIGGKLPPFPLAAPLSLASICCCLTRLCY